MAKGILNIGGGVVSVDASGNFTVETGLIADGSSVFNETGVDVDFRIESDDNVNMFFVDGGNDRVGIGIATPKTHLTVEGTVTLKEQSAAGADTAGYGQIWVDDAANSPLMFTNDAGADIAITSGSTLAGLFDADGAQVFNETGADVDFRVESNNEANMLFIDGGTDKVGIGTNAVAAGQGTLTVYGRMQVTRGSAFQTLTTSAWAME